MIKDDKKISERLDGNGNRIITMESGEVMRFSTRTGKRINAPGFKKGVPRTLTRAVVEGEMHKVLDLVRFGAKKIKNEENKKEGVKNNVPLTIKQACRELGMNQVLFNIHLSKYPDLKLEYRQYRDNIREIMKNNAEDRMLQILEEGDLTDKERFDASFKIVQSTMKEYNPKAEIESKSISINLSKTTDDLIGELKMLLGQN